MTNRVQHRPNTTSSAAPAGLLPYEIGLSTGDGAARVHVGVPASVDPSGAVQVAGPGTDAGGYVVKATGATTLRTLAQQAGDVVNVLDFGAKGDGATDDTAAFQAAFNRAIALGADRAVKVYAPGGRYLLNSQVVATIPGGIGVGQYNGIVIVADGPHATKLIAGANNADGLIKIVAPYEKHHIRVEGIQFVSNLDARTEATRTNGKGLWITSNTASDAVPLDGVYNGYSCHVKDCLFMADSVDEGEAQVWLGIWDAALQIDFQYLPVLENVVVNVSTDPTFAAYTNPNANRHGIRFKHCYTPRVLHCNVHGNFRRGLAFEGTLTDPMSPGRWEGGLVASTEVGSCLDGLVIDNPYTYEPSIWPPEFRIIGGHYNNRRHSIRVNYQSSVTVQTCNIFVPYQAPPGEVLPSSIYLENGSDVVISSCQFDSEGFYTDDDHASCAIRIDSITAAVLITGNKFAHGGISVRANNTQPGNELLSPRSIHVVGNSWMGRRNYSWAVNKKVVDKNGTVVLVETLQDSQTDRHRVESYQNGTNYSPAMQVARLRNDYATNTTNVQLGRFDFIGYNSAGAEATAGRTRAQWVNSASGAETANYFLEVPIGGVMTPVMVFDGFAQLFEFARRLYVNGQVSASDIICRTSHTPSSTADSSGTTGHYYWDNDYFYVKTSAGWKRAALSTF